MLRRSPFYNRVVATNHSKIKPVSTCNLFASKRRCSAGGGAGGDTESGFFGGGPFGSVFRFLGLTAAFAIGSFTIIIVSWPVLDAIALPLLFKRAISRGGDQFRSSAMLRSELPSITSNENTSDFHEYDQTEVENLSEMLFPNSVLPPSSASSSSTITKSDSSIVLLCGPPGSNKSELARRVVQHTSVNRKNKNNQEEYEDRPVLYINLRGYVDPATFLHGTLTYLLIPTLGTIGALVHAYIKLVNAGTDILTMNNGHDHNSFIFFAMTMGHIRQSMFAIRDQQLKNNKTKSDSSDHRPLVIIDHVEQFLHNQQLYGKDATVNLMAQMMMTFLVRAAVDEKICNLLLVSESSVLTDKLGIAASMKNNCGGRNDTSGSSSTNILVKNNSNRSNGDYSYRGYVNFHGDQLFYDDYLLRNSGLNSGATVFDASSTNNDLTSSYSSLSNCDLLACFPILDQRIKFAYALPRQVFDRLQLAQNISAFQKQKFDLKGDEAKMQNSEEYLEAANSALQFLEYTNSMPDEVCRKLLNRCVSSSSPSSSSPPPLLLGWVASLLLNNTITEGNAIDATTLAESLDQDQETIISCLQSLENHGLIDRVAGTSLLFPSADEELLRSHHSSSRITAPSFLASETLRKMTGKQILENSTVEVKIPIRNVKMNQNNDDDEGKFSRKRTAKIEEENEKNTIFANQNVYTSSIVYKKVQLSLQDTLDRETVLEKLSLAATTSTRGQTEEEIIMNTLADKKKKIQFWNGIVLPRKNNSNSEEDSSVLIATQEEFDRELKSLRNGEVVTPLMLPAAAPKKNSEGGEATFQRRANVIMPKKKDRTNHVLGGLLLSVAGVATLFGMVLN